MSLGKGIGLNFFYCNMITMGSDTSSKTYLALSLYNNLHTKFYMHIKYHPKQKN